MPAWGHNGFMADVKIRRLPDWVVATVKARARSAGRSLEEELRILLTEAAGRSKLDRAAELSAFRGMLRRKYGAVSDSTAGIRADREARG
jgi:plasmid stability protein